MPRKKADSLEAGREAIKRRYIAAGGKKTVRGKLNVDELTDEDREWLRTKALFLKSTDASYSYISDAIRIPRGTVKSWFDDDDMKKKVADLRNDMVAGAIKYLRTYAIELVEILVTIAKDETVDAKIRIQAVNDALDRIGLSKVNKSESVTANLHKEQFELTDAAGIVERLKDNPQLAIAAAQKIEELDAIVGEGVVT